MFPFNRYTKGLLGFLDAKTQGLGPASFEDAVRGTVDLAPFMAHGAAQLYTGVQIIASGFQGFLEVGPAVGEGEIGLLLGLGARFQTAMIAGDQVTWNLSMRRGFSGNFHEAVGQAASFSNVALPAANAAVILPRVMLPGDTVGIWLTSTTFAANRNVALCAVIQLIRV